MMLKFLNENKDKKLTEEFLKDLHAETIKVFWIVGDYTEM